MILHLPYLLFLLVFAKLGQTVRPVSYTHLSINALDYLIQIRGYGLVDAVQALEMCIRDSQPAIKNIVATDAYRRFYSFASRRFRMIFLSCPRLLS